MLSEKEKNYHTLINAFKLGFNERGKTYFRIQQILYNELMVHKEPTYDYKDLDELYCCFNKVFKVDISKQKTGNREHERVAVRHLFIYQARQIFGSRYTLVSLGKFLEIDHTTVIYAIKNTRNKLLTNDALVALISEKWDDFDKQKRLAKYSVEKVSHIVELNTHNKSDTLLTPCV